MIILQKCFCVPEEYTVKMLWPKFEAVIQINKTVVLFASNEYNGNREFEKIAFKDRTILLTQLRQFC